MNYNGLIGLFMQMGVAAAAGMILKKHNIITARGKSILTDLVLGLFLPCNIIKSFQIKFNHEILLRSLTVLIISCILQLVCTFISAKCYKKVPKRQRMVLQYGTVCSNAGFIGNPVAEGIYGSMGLLYASIYLIPQRIVMWTAGISYFTETPDKKTVLKTVLTHPCIIAVEIGVMLMLLQIRLPFIFSFAIGGLSKYTTALSMLVIGTILADVNFKTILSKLTLIYSMIRLLLIPALVLSGCLLFHINDIVTGVSVVLAAMPAGSTTAILASKYNGDAEFATKCVVLTTLLSIFIIPFWVMLLNMILNT